MKNLKNPLILLVLVFGFLTVGCSDDDDNNGNQNFQNYGFDQFGNCIDQNRQPVPSQLCNNLQGQRQYGYDFRGQCVDLFTGFPVQQGQEWLCSQQVNNNQGQQFPGQIGTQFPNNQGGIVQSGICLNQSYSDQWGNPVQCFPSFNPNGSTCSGRQLYTHWGLVNCL